jgi:DNA-binding CsgD family transcriptional regulator
MFDYDRLVGSIYDCAANPELWPNTLETIRDELGAAYAIVGFGDMTPLRFQQPPIFTMRNTPWDEARLAQLSSLTQEVPGSEKIYDGRIDETWTQMNQISFEEFSLTHFYKFWAEPQGLSDSLNVPFLSKPGILGALSCAKRLNQGVTFGERECRLAEAISPHIRRTIMINDIVDKGKQALALYRSVLDKLSVAVFIVGPGRRLVFGNELGEELLSAGNFILSSAGTLQALRTTGSASSLDEAIDRASKGDSAIGISGIGVPLIGNDGERAAAYVLPIAGKDLRGAMGQGHCAVFVARRGEQQPMAIEILRTLFDLTVQEARVATLIAKGDRPQAIAEALTISVNTVRSHLQHIYAKTNTPDPIKRR